MIKCVCASGNTSSRCLGSPKMYETSIPLTESNFSCCKAHISTPPIAAPLSRQNITFLFTPLESSDEFLLSSVFLRIYANSINRLSTHSTEYIFFSGKPISSNWRFISPEVLHVINISALIYLLTSNGDIILTPSIYVPHLSSSESTKRSGCTPMTFEKQSILCPILPVPQKINFLFCIILPINSSAETIFFSSAPHEISMSLADSETRSFLIVITI